MVYLWMTQENHVACCLYSLRDQVQSQWSRWRVLTRHVLSRRFAGLSVHSTANCDSPRRDNNATRSGADDRPCDNGGTPGSDAACANHAARADDGACFHGAQGDEGSCDE